jgi:hypothetical protein
MAVLAASAKIRGRPASSSRFARATDNELSMRFSSPSRRAVRALQQTIVTLVALGCVETPTAPRPTPAIAPASPAGPTQLVARVACVADVRSQRLECDSGPSSSASIGFGNWGSPGINPDLIVGGQNSFVKLTSSSVVYSAGVFSFDVTVQNLIGQALGTTDGTTAAASGVRVFFQDPPTTLTGTGTITTNNQDGFATFTQSNQAFFQYNTMLATSQTSATKNWKLNVPATATTFEFFVYVSAPVQFPTGWIDLVPPSAQLTTGQTTTLTPTVRDVIGRTVTGQTVTWGTNNSAVATVNPSTGLITAVGTGFATITATSGTRTGLAQVAVAPPGSMIADAGDAQVGSAAAPVGTAPRIRVLDQNSNPLSNVPVTFSVTGGGGSATGTTTTTDVNGYATVGSWTLGSGGASCSAATITSCSRNALHAVANNGAGPSVDFKAYIPPIVPAAATYQAVGNSSLGIPANIGLLANVYSINGSGPNGQGAPLAMVATTVAGSQGGSVTVATDGSFSYLTSTTYVSAGATTEDFTISVGDGLAGNVVPVQVNVPFHVWHVRPGFAGTSNGQQNTPYKDFSPTSGQGVQSVAGASDIILVQTGTGVATGGGLASGQTVYGAGASAPMTYTPVAGYRNAGIGIGLITIGAAPQIGALTLNSDNTLRGLAITTSTATALEGAPFGTLTVSETSLNATGRTALILGTGALAGSGFSSITSTGGTNNLSFNGVSTSGTVSLGSGAMSGASSDAFKIANSDGTFTYSGSIANTATLAINLNGITGGGVTLSGNINSLASPGKGVQFVNSSGGSVTLSGTEVGISTAAGNGVHLNANSGSAALSIAAGALQVATTTGIGVNSTTGGTLSISGSNNTINSTTGTAINFSTIVVGASGIAFNSVSSGGGTNNISIQSAAGSGSITLGTGALSGASGASAFVSGGSAPISYAGSVSKTSTGQLISVGNRTAGNVTFSGDLSCTTSCGSALGAIRVASVTGGTVTFSGATKTLTTGATNAVILSSNTGGTMAFPNGGLAITTTGTAVAFASTGGGALTVSGANNTIGAAGQAINFNGGSIGAAGVTFASVTSAGGTNNIGLTGVSGTGAMDFGDGALSGGTNAFVISGTNVNAVLYSGSISKTTAGQLVDISGHGSDEIDISGNLSCTASCGSGGGAIRVTGNSGGTIQFLGLTKTLSPASGSSAVTLSANGGAAVHFGNGGLAITTTNANGFGAFGTGIVEVSGPGNTIATTGQSALQLSGTRIGDGGMEFYSIAASPTSNSGIILNTVAGGPFTVTGDGGSSLNDNTRGRTDNGGSIALGSGGSITTNANTAVSLTAVEGVVTLSNMVIRSTSGDLIAGSNFANGLALDNMLLGGVGTGTSGNGLTVAGAPMVTFLHTEISGNATTGPTTKRNVNLSPIDGYIDMQYCLFESSYNDLFKADVNGQVSTYQSSFNGSTNGDGFVAVVSGSSAVSLSLTESAFSGNREGVRIDHASQSGGYYLINGNDIQSNTTSGAHGIEVLRSGSGGGVIVEVLGNNIGTAGTAKSGSATGNGIQVEERGDGGYMQVSIVGNQIREYAVHGIALISGSTPNGHLLAAKVSSNNIASPGVSSLDGISGVHGTTSTDTPTVCYNIFSNTVSALRNGISLTEGSGMTPAPLVQLHSWDRVTAPATYLANLNGSASGGVNNVVFTNGSGETTNGLCSTL